MTVTPSQHRCRLKYAATINDEALSEETSPDFELRYIDIGNVDSTGTIREVTTFDYKSAPSRARRRVRHGDIIISTVRTYLQAIAPIEHPPDNLIVSTGFAVVRPRNNILDTGFCKYVLREPLFLSEVVARSVGVNYPTINSSELANIPIELPPLDTQHQIAEYIDVETAQLDSLVIEKERMLALLDEKRAAIICRVVTQGLNNTNSIKSSNISWLDKVPNHWEVRRCANLFSEIDERDNPDLPLLQVSLNSGVTLRIFLEDRIETVAEDFTTYKVARQDDLVFNKMRFWQGAVGIAPADGLTSPDYTVARIDKRLLLPRYVELLFRIPQFNGEVKRYSHGIVDDRLRLYWDEFKNIRIPVPPLAEQQMIVDAIDNEIVKLSKLQTVLKNSVTLLKERRSALITAVVTGQLNLEESQYASRSA